MLKKRISYVDYDGNERTEDFYFNLDRRELSEMNYQVDGGLDKMLQRIIDSQDTRRIVEFFTDLIKKSYGKKSPDGRRFIKNEEVLEDFLQTEAYTELYMELIGDADKASAFVRGIIPKQLLDAADANVTRLQNQYTKNEREIDATDVKVVK